MLLHRPGGVTCQSPLLKTSPTKSPLKSGRRAMGRKFKSPPRQAPPKNKKLSYCWETVRRESMPRIAEMDVEMTT